MRIKVYALPFAGCSHLDESGCVEIEDGATLKDLFKKLKIPFAPGAVYFCKVNYEQASLNMQLKEGDTVSFYSPLAGG